jgi:hypothetical protein
MSRNPKRRPGSYLVISPWLSSRSGPILLVDSNREPSLVGPGSLGRPSIASHSSNRAISAMTANTASGLAAIDSSYAKRIIVFVSFR